MGDSEAGMQRSTRARHNAMGGPEDLVAIGQFDGLERLAARMAGGEGDVAGRMPVLRNDDGLEILGDLIDDGHHGIAIGDCERPAGAKIVLDIDHQQGSFILHGSNIGDLRRRYRQGAG